jgi:hypothetical protein
MAWQEVYQPQNKIEVVAITSNLQSGVNYGNLPYGYPDNPFRLDEVVSQARKNKQPVYFMENSDFYNEHWQLNSGGFTTNDQALIKPILCEETRASDKAWQEMEVLGNSNIQRWRREWLIKQKQYIGKGEPCLKSEAHEQTALACLKNNQNGCALRAALSAVQKAPGEFEYRFNLARIMEQANLLPLAKREYRVANEIKAGDTRVEVALKRLAPVEDLALHQLVFSEANDD